MEKAWSTLWNKPSGPRPPVERKTTRVQTPLAQELLTLTLTAEYPCSAVYVPFKLCGAPSGPSVSCIPSLSPQFLMSKCPCFPHTSVLTSPSSSPSWTWTPSLSCSSLMFTLQTCSVGLMWVKLMAVGIKRLWDVFAKGLECCVCVYMWNVRLHQCCNQIQAASRVCKKCCSKIHWLELTGSVSPSWKIISYQVQFVWTWKDFSIAFSLHELQGDFLLYHPLGSWCAVVQQTPPGACCRMKIYPVQLAWVSALIHC